MTVYVLLNRYQFPNSEWHVDASCYASATLAWRYAAESIRDCHRERVPNWFHDLCTRGLEFEAVARWNDHCPADTFEVQECHLWEEQGK